MTPAQKIAKARSYILLKEPFFGYLIMQTPIKARSDIPTFATDMISIYYSPKFTDSLSLKDVVFILLHEIMHIVGKHGMRRGGRDKHVWNKACDYFINLFLVSIGYTMVSGGLIDRKFQKMSSERIYDILQEEQEAGGGDSCVGDQPYGAGEAVCGGDDLLKPVSGDDATTGGRARSAQIDGMVSAASTMAEMAGKMSVPLRRLVSELLTPKVPWHEVLAEYMTDLIEGDENWSMRDRRFQDVFLPEICPDPSMGELVVIGDSSGSVSDKDLQMVATETASCADMLNPSQIRLIWATSEVVAETVFERGDQLKFESPETGGTDMRVPLAHVEQYDPAAVVLITDGHTPWPTIAPPYPLIVCCTSDVSVPFGRVIRV